MEEFGKRGSNTNLTKDLGLNNLGNLYWNLSPAELIEDTILMGEGVLTDTGAIAVNTGEFTGRSPKDRFIVCDEVTENAVWWGDINMKFDSDKFDRLFDRMKAYMMGMDLYVRDSYVCADKNYKLNVRVVTELPWANMFAYNMFLRPTDEEIENFSPDWHIVCVPSFLADPEIDGTRQGNFSILNFKRKLIIIGGSEYTGEIKKGVFSALNFILPHEKNVLSMHCSANVGKDGDTAIFFGLSGTGKTTLSSDPNRRLIGDDEHGWDDNGSVFNFEGGCYAKTINLSREHEPQIYDAIKYGAILENIGFQKNSPSTPDYSDATITQNTRVSYPIYHIDNIMNPQIGHNPKNIFFLTCDAFGVLPPISKLTNGQAMYHFISGYTAKVAGTEEGVTEPQTVFSACFGAPFMPLHPAKYAKMLGEKIEKENVNVWLINTGWTGGGYGVGERMSLKHTRAMITAAMEGDLDNVDYVRDDIFGLNMPTSCPNVPTEVLNPKNTWTDKQDYDQKATELAQKFLKNFEVFEAGSSQDILNAAPKVLVR
ncbi:MAG: phosphoenolpyruvate carboxykinase (ATP) [Brumimicrobium sp.]